MTKHVFKLPGDPYSWKRVRGVRTPKGVRMYPHPDNVKWASWVRAYLISRAEQEGLDLPLFTGPVSVTVIAVFPRPKSTYRKTKPRRRETHTKKPDVDNVLKAVMDAGTGILWTDDSQVWHSEVMKFVGAQDESPFTTIVVEDI